MSEKSAKLSIWLSNATLESLAGLADRSGLTRGELIRRALVDYVTRHDTGEYSMSRIAETVEYIQICLQHHLIDDDAIKHDRIIDILDERMAEFHGR